MRQICILVPILPSERQRAFTKAPRSSGSGSVLRTRAACGIGALVSILLVISACGTEPPALPDGNPGGQEYTLTWGPVEVGPLEEDTRCVTLRLGNDIPLKIDRIHNTLGTASHHFIVYRVAEGEINETPTPCFPFVDTLDPTAGAPLMITQRPDEVLQLPDGVGFSLPADQLIRLEMHFINAGTEPVMAEATTELHAMADADFEQEADFLFIGNPDIQLPSSPSVQTLGPTYFPIPQGLDGASVFAITGHTHKLGVDVEVETATAADAPGTVVYDPTAFSWSEPETVIHDPPFTIPADGGFRFTCSWLNDTGDYVQFGESANDEMCFFWAYYYPSQGSKVCVHSEIYTENPIDICCPDDVLCALINEYLDGNLPQ